MRTKKKGPNRIQTQIEFGTWRYWSKSLKLKDARFVKKAKDEKNERGERWIPRAPGEGTGNIMEPTEDATAETLRYTDEDR